MRLVKSICYLFDIVECFVSGVESYALGTIREGTPIGLWVKES